MTHKDSIAESLKREVKSLGRRVASLARENKGLSAKIKDMEGRDKIEVRGRELTSECVVSVLAPFDDLFLSNAVLDSIVEKTSIPDLLEARAPRFPGVILYGPPGTGKSEIQRALIRVFTNSGAHAEDVLASDINNPFVGQFAKNLQERLENASSMSDKKGLPSMVSFDEGTIFAERAEIGAYSVSRHYTEAMEVMKSFIGNDRGKGLVLAISTNSHLDDFDPALTRDGRLTPLLIGFPCKEQITRMWMRFTEKYGLGRISENDA
ncbi:MAG: AAA family ATPase, partial [Nanoarchaeota archaeon]